MIIIVGISKIKKLYEVEALILSWGYWSKFRLDTSISFIERSFWNWCVIFTFDLSCSDINLSENKVSSRTVASIKSSLRRFVTRSVISQFDVGKLARVIINGTRATLTNSDLPSFSCLCSYLTRFRIFINLN